MSSLVVAFDIGVQLMLVSSWELRRDTDASGLSGLGFIVTSNLKTKDIQSLKRLL
jgi:hypothetical protein